MQNVEDSSWNVLRLFLWKLKDENQRIIAPKCCRIFSPISYKNSQELRSGECGHNRKSGFCVRRSQLEIASNLLFRAAISEHKKGQMDSWRLVGFFVLSKNPGPEKQATCCVLAVLASPFKHDTEKGHCVGTGISFADPWAPWIQENTKKTKKIPDLGWVPGKYEKNTEIKCPQKRYPPDRGQSRKIRFSKFPGSRLKKI